MAQNKDLVANAQTLLEENLSEKKSVESARRLLAVSLCVFRINTFKTCGSESSSISIVLNDIKICLHWLILEN